MSTVSMLLKLALFSLAPGSVQARPWFRSSMRIPSVAGNSNIVWIDFHSTQNSHSFYSLLLVFKLSQALWVRSWQTPLRSFQLAPVLRCNYIFQFYFTFYTKFSRDVYLANLQYFWILNHFNFAFLCNTKSISWAMLLQHVLEVRKVTLSKVQ